MALRGEKAGARPVTASDKKLSARHLKDSIRYNERHATEHLREERKARTKLKSLKKRK